MRAVRVGPAGRRTAWAPVLRDEDAARLWDVSEALVGRTVS
ncbi:hypothetical protein [Curtobacterium sp. 1544]